MKPEKGRECKEKERKHNLSGSFIFVYSVSLCRPNFKESQNLSPAATKDEDPVQMQRENPSEEYKILFIYTVSSLGFRSILSQTCCCVIEDLPHQMLI